MFLKPSTDQTDQELLVEYTSFESHVVYPIFLISKPVPRDAQGITQAISCLTQLVMALVTSSLVLFTCAYIFVGHF